MEYTLEQKRKLHGTVWDGKGEPPPNSNLIVLVGTDILAEGSYPIDQSIIDEYIPPDQVITGKHIDSLFWLSQAEMIERCVIPKIVEYFCTWMLDGELINIGKEPSPMTRELGAIISNLQHEDIDGNITFEASEKFSKYPIVVRETAHCREHLSVLNGYHRDYQQALSAGDPEGIEDAIRGFLKYAKHNVRFNATNIALEALALEEEKTPGPNCILTGTRRVREDIMDHGYKYTTEGRAVGIVQEDDMRYAQIESGHLQRLGFKLCDNTKEGFYYKMGADRLNHTDKRRAPSWTLPKFNFSKRPYNDGTIALDPLERLNRGAIYWFPEVAEEIINAQEDKGNLKPGHTTSTDAEATRNTPLSTNKNPKPFNR